MKSIGLAVPLTAIALVTEMAAPRALDCRSIATSIDQTICADKALTSDRQWLDDVYRNTLRRLDQRSHDLLVDDQRRWTQDQAAQCANLPVDESPRTACISATIRARRAEITRQFPAPTRSDLPNATAFEGYWRGRSEYSASFTLRQRGARVCGTWFYYATGAGYDGRLVWAVEGKAADWRFICGRPGSETGLPCSNGSPQHWELATGPDAAPKYVCAQGGERYLIDLERSCRETDDYTMRWHPVNAARQDLKHKNEAPPPGDDWLQNCLNDPTYPDPSTVQERP